MEAEIDGWFYRGTVVSYDDSEGASRMFQIKFASKGWNKVHNNVLKETNSSVSM